jgi:hypothetical protein
MPGKQGRVMLKPKVMEHFKRVPGTQQYIGDLAKQFNSTEHQIQECIAGILRTHSLPGLNVEVRARSWMYRPPAQVPERTAGKRMFEEIGQAKEGIVIQDESGSLYLAKEL